MSRRLAGLVPIALIAIVTLAGCGNASRVAPRTDAVAAPQGSPSDARRITTSPSATRRRTSPRSGPRPARSHLAGRPSDVPQLNLPPTGVAEADRRHPHLVVADGGEAGGGAAAVPTPAGASGSGMRQFRRRRVGLRRRHSTGRPRPACWPCASLEVTAQAVGVANGLPRRRGHDVGAAARSGHVHPGVRAAPSRSRYGSRRDRRGRRQADTFGPVTVGDPAQVARDHRRDQRRAGGDAGRPSRVPLVAGAG